MELFKRKESSRCGCVGLTTGYRAFVQQRPPPTRIKLEIIAHSCAQELFVMRKSLENSGDPTRTFESIKAVNSTGEILMLKPLLTLFLVRWQCFGYLFLHHLRHWVKRFKFNRPREKESLDLQILTLIGRNWHKKLVLLEFLYRNWRYLFSETKSNWDLRTISSVISKHQRLKQNVCV